MKIKLISKEKSPKSPKLQQKKMNIEKVKPRRKLTEREKYVLEVLNVNKR